MDFVYPLARGSLSQDAELKYSLRSLEQHAPSLDKVWIATTGPLPQWLNTQAIVHVRTGQSYGKPTLNTLRKALDVCKDSALSDDFVYMNDDIFLLRNHWGGLLTAYSGPRPSSPEDEPRGAKLFSVNLPGFPYHYRGTIAEAVESSGKRTGEYDYARKNTLDYLRKRGVKDPLNFECHRPLVFNRLLFTELCAPLLPRMQPCLWSSVYCNLAGVPGVPGTDVKVYNAAALVDESVVRDCVSTENETLLDAAAVAWLQSKFPTPSRYER